VARVTTSGVFTEYAIPTASSSPNGIAAGPDGNLWFTEGIGKVAKIVAGAAATPTSFCVSGANAGFPVACTLYESRAGAPSEVSDVVPIPQPPGVVPSNTTVLIENPNLPQNDPKNWSDVIEFIPQTPGSPVGSPSTSVEMLSVGCGNLQDPTDITCFPAAATVTQFVVETQTGTGDDFRDCTPFSVIFQGQDAVDVHACSDSPAVETGDTVPIPEVPLPILLPIGALGVVVAGYGWRRRTSSRV
jgi:hypothetical protein